MIGKHQPPHPVSGLGKPGAPAQFGALLMTDSGTQRSGPPYLFSGLTETEIAHVLGSGKRRVLYRGAQLFSQGSPQDGIFLIESGRIKVFYTAPSGREITLAYWHSGNFVGGPEVFKQGLHVWSGVAAVNSTVLHLPGDVLRRMVMKISGARHRHHRGPRLQGPMLFRAGANARDALADRAACATSAAPDEFVRRRRTSWHLDRCVVHARRPRAYDGRNASVRHR